MVCCRRSSPQSLIFHKFLGLHHSAAAPKSTSLWVYGYMGIWVYGYMGIWVYGYMGIKVEMAICLQLS